MEEQTRFAYNVCVGDYRIDQFDSPDEAKKFIEELKTHTYITQSEYVYDEDCCEWNEVTEKGYTL